MKTHSRILDQIWTERHYLRRWQVDPNLVVCHPSVLPWLYRDPAMFPYLTAGERVPPVFGMRVLVHGDLPEDAFVVGRLQTMELEAIP